jgi:AcrR family transcriptional regulator
MIELAAEAGYGGVTIRDVARAAGVSKPTFYKFFADKEDCFASTYDHVIRCAARNVLASQSADDDWAARARLGIEAFFESLEAAPKAARLALLTGLEVGPQWRQQERHATDLFATIVRDSFGDASGGLKLPLPIARAVVWGATEIARSRMLRGEDHLIGKLAEPVAEWALSISQDGGRRIGDPPSSRPSTDSLAKLICRLDPPEAPADVRGLIHAATTEIAAADGFSSLGVKGICGTAGVSRRAFFDEFNDLGDCFLATVRKRAARLQTILRLVRDSVDRWEEGVDLVARTLCTIAATDPASRLEFVDLAELGAAGVAVRSELITELAAILIEDETASPRTWLEAHASAAVMWTAIAERLATGHQFNAERLAGFFTHICLAPGWHAVQGGRCAAVTAAIES